MFGEIAVGSEGAFRISDRGRAVRICIFIVAATAKTAIPTEQARIVITIPNESGTGLGSL
jgi:hypothetical protein